MSISPLFDSWVLSRRDGRMEGRKADEGEREGGTKRRPFFIERVQNNPLRPHRHRLPLQRANRPIDKREFVKSPSFSPLEINSS